MSALRTADPNVVTPGRGAASSGRSSGGLRLFEDKSPNPSRRHFTESKVVAVPDGAQHTGLRMSAGPASAAERQPQADRVRLKRTCSPVVARVETPSGRRHVQSTAPSIISGCNVEASPQRRLLRRVPSPPHEEPSSVRSRAAVPAPPQKEERLASKGMVTGLSERNWACSQAEKYRPGRHMFAEGPPTSRSTELGSDGLVIPAAGPTSAVCFLTSHKKHFHDTPSAAPDVAPETPRSGRKLVQPASQPPASAAAATPRTDSPRGRRHYAAHNTESAPAAPAPARIRSPSPPPRGTGFSFQGDVPPRPQGIGRTLSPALSTRPW